MMKRNGLCCSEMSSLKIALKMNSLDGEDWHSLLWLHALRILNEVLCWFVLQKYKDIDPFSLLWKLKECCKECKGDYVCFNY